MFKLNSTWHNFTFGQCSVARKLIINFRSYQPTVLLFSFFGMKLFWDDINNTSSWFGSITLKSKFCTLSHFLKNLFCKFLYLGMNLSKDGTNQLPRVGFDWITLNVTLKVWKNLIGPFSAILTHIAHLFKICSVKLWRDKFDWITLKVFSSGNISLY